MTILALHIHVLSAICKLKYKILVTMSIRPLSPECAEIARMELNEDPKRISSDIQHMKDWISKQPHLRASIDDQWLVAFLRGCKYSLERTKEKFDLYYTLRNLMSELFTIKHNDPVFDQFLNSGAFVVLPESANPREPRTMILRAGAVDPEKFNILQIFPIMTTIQKILLMDSDKMVICGSQWIIDFKDVKISHFLQITPALMKKMIMHSQDASPIRIKGNHFVNAPAAFETLLSTMKSFLNEKNRKRLYVYKSYEELYENIPKAILPKEYGGSSTTIKEIVDDWIAKRNKYSSWLENDEKCGTDESKRPGKPKTREDLFGIEGSFRQLEFD